MTKLNLPVREHLTPPFDEGQIQRIWAGVRRRRGGSWFAQRVAASRWAFGFAGALLALLLLAIDLRLQARHPNTAGNVANGPLLTQSGDTLTVLGGKPASNSALSDGSAIELAAGARLEVLENTAKTFVSVLRSGRARFAVQPGGPRRWTIESGLATVEVVGTRFSVTRSDGAVEVSVEHGVVLVRSELIQDHVQRLTAGQRILIHRALPEPIATVPSTPPLATPASPAADVSVAHTVVRVTLQALLDQADERRQRGDVRGAEAALRAALAEHASEPQAALAAFTLGKLLLDTAGRPSDAAHAFARCLALTPPSALAEDALYRLAEARARAGQLDAARRTAEEYRSRYPNGQHLRQVEQWVSER